MADGFLNSRSLSYYINEGRDGIFSVSLVIVISVAMETRMAYVAYGPRFSGRQHVSFDALASDGSKLMPKLAYAMARLDEAAFETFESLTAPEKSAFNQRAGGAVR